MLLLLTRAAEDAVATRRKLEAARHHVLLSPVLSFRSLVYCAPTHLPDAIVATSPRAFSMLMAERLAPAVRRQPLYLVGRRTLEAARAQGFAAPATVADDGASLAGVLRGLPRGRMLYLAGVDRKPDIEAGLTAAGHQVSVIETYEAVAAQSLTPEAVAALESGRVGAVLHYSRRSAAIFVILSQAARLDILRPLHICLSPDVAKALPPLGKAWCADTPGETAMLALTDRLS